MQFFGTKMLVIEYGEEGISRVVYISGPLVGNMGVH